MKKKINFSEERGLSHVYRIDDDVMSDVLDFIVTGVQKLSAVILPQTLLNLSDFLSKTKVLYRSKSRFYEWKK